MITFFVYTRRVLVILIGFAIPISTALTNVLCPLAILLLLAEGQYKQKFNILSRHPLAVIALLLFTIMSLGFLYTPVNWVEAGRMLDKYRELLYIPLFILLFADEKTRRWGLYAFLSAMGVTLFLSYLMTLTGWSIGKGTPQNAFVFKNYITQGLLLALAAYFLAVYAWQQQRWYWLVMILLALYNILFLSEGRTGYLIVFCLILLFSYQTYRLRGLIVGSLLLVLLSGLIYSYSDVVKKRLDSVSENLQHYQQGETDTSVGLRLEFYKNSLVLIAQSPLWGHGTGSFRYEYQQLAQPQGITATTNPHNEYLMIGVQWGLMGMGLFIYLLYQLGLLAVYLPPPQNWMVQGLVVTIAVGCLVNSLLLDTTEGHLFAYLIGVLMGGLNYPKAIFLFRRNHPETD
ncbi:lipid A core-O-antigen ligase-like enzyme [Thioploca ingrica]|uniref:Lipid A core-O-antigen ligase-like enzyme n=1 Tax=Thioploca ingrica TaxID=40754 RepID=A0A090AJY8_9GAMM|nr:lipid A core-O-antigen ligase-like enzyme [Thioploca ingrica]